MVINDLLAMGVIRAVYDLGLRVPEDISVAGYDDIDSSNYLVPRLTTVRTDAKAEGKLLTRLLLDRLNNPGLPAKTVELSARLVIRESTGPAPAVGTRRRAKVPLDWAVSLHICPYIPNPDRKQAGSFRPPTFRASALSTLV